MPFISVTNTFANGNTSDASQVNQNFTDLINGTSDGTKNFNISALTCAGTTTINANVTLGSSSANTVTFTASLASSIPISITNSYDIGSSTLGLRSIYIGANSQTVRLLGSAAMSATWTLTLPVSAGSSGQFLQTDGSGVSVWATIQKSPSDAQNYSLAAAVAANALTVTLNAADGTSPSSSNSVNVNVRNATAATGTPTLSTTTSALTISVPSGATLGHLSAKDQYVHVYLIQDSSTEIGVCGTKFFDEGTLQSSTAITSGSTVANVLYSTSNHTSRPVRYLGRIKSNQTTAGTWASAPTEISLVSRDTSYIETVYLKEVQTSGTSGGTFTSGAWQTRTLNTLENVLNCNWVTLSSNQFILLPGTYKIIASAPSFNVDRNKAKLRNITDSTDDIIGSTEQGTGSVSIRSVVTGLITISSAKTYEIQHQCQTTGASTGFGSADSLSVSEIYTIVEITKLK